MFLLPVPGCGVMAGSEPASEAIERAFHPGAGLAQDVSVDHGGGNVLMPQQFLDGANVSATLEGMGREAVSKSMAGDSFDDADTPDRCFDGLIDSRLVHMMPANLSGAWVPG